VGLFLLLLVFDVIGAAMVFLISYDELSRRSAERRVPLREAARRALVAFLFLAALSALIVLIVQHETP
jgi:small neutral amino acid transporter SnatA (MarC family)